MNSTIFVTRVRSLDEKSCARWLIDSIRTFGGVLCDSPIWLFEVNPERTSCGDLATNGVQVLPLNVPERLRNFLFGDKVYACAQAEEMASPQALASGDTLSLVWIDPTCLVVQPPLLFNLGQTFDAAVRPVHIRNVGLLANDPLDDFWKTVYATVGIEDTQMTADSFVDAQHLRAYFNSHAFAINPAKGLMRLWFDRFNQLVGDAGFQAQACADERHQVFLHQAVLSALFAAALAQDRIRILPPTYNYPCHLHAQVSMENRPHWMNDLVCFTYDEDSIQASQMTDIPVAEPLRSWLAARSKS